MILLAYTRSMLGKITPKVRLLFSPKYLLPTNMAITSSLSSLGDILQQSYEIAIQRQENWNKTRTFHVSITGLVLGPPCHFWYKFLDHYLPGRAARVIVKKLVLDQIFCAPVMIFLFLTTLGLLEKSSLQQMLVDFEECGKPLLLADWLVWPPAQVINFYFLPSKYRVLYDNTISLGFDIYYSFVKFCRDRKSGKNIEEILDNNKNTLLSSSWLLLCSQTFGRNFGLKVTKYNKRHLKKIGEYNCQNIVNMTTTKMRTTVRNIKNNLVEKCKKA